MLGCMVVHEGLFPHLSEYGAGLVEGCGTSPMSPWRSVTLCSEQNIGLQEAGFHHLWSVESQFSCLAAVLQLQEVRPLWRT